MSITRVYLHEGVANRKAIRRVCGVPGRIFGTDERCRGDDAFYATVREKE